MRVVHQREIANRISQCAVDRTEAAVLGRRLQDVAKSLDQDRHELNAMMLRELPVEFRNRCLGVAPLDTSEVERRLGVRLEEWFSIERSEISGTAFEQYLDQTLQKLFSEWQSRYRDQIEIAFQELTSRQGNRIDPIVAKIATLPARVLGVERPSDVQFRNDIPCHCANFTRIFGSFRRPGGTNWCRSGV
jgi:hypothetical protein